VSLLPSTLFGRLLTSVLLAVSITLVVIVALIVLDRRELTLQVGGIAHTAHRIAYLTSELERLEGDARAARFKALASIPDLMVNPSLYERRVVPRSEIATIRHAFVSDLQQRLGPGYGVSVQRTTRANADVIHLVDSRNRSIVGFLDVSVHLPDGDKLTFRVLPPPPVPPLPWLLFAQLGGLTAALVVILYAVTRSVTKPLANLAQAAEAAGRSVRLPPLSEEGVSEIREAARAFNSMQDRLLRYLDSRTAVLAAMSHDLRTPLTRLRLRVESVSEPQLRTRFRADLDEMEALVRSALALFGGVDDDEAFETVDMNVQLDMLVVEYTEIGANVSLASTTMARPIEVKPRALKRCLRNLIDNAIKFGRRAMIRADDGEVLVISVSDEGPGIPEDSLERVFEPFTRLESSRSRETGGAGLGLSIARDIAQAHGGTLKLRNRSAGGLTAELQLPREK
jgi:signal transduction histidine kinase